VRYIASKFVDKKYVEGFTAGKPDYGFTIEAMLQLRAAGQTAKSFAPAVAYNLQSAVNLGNASSKTGFLYVSQKFQPGRAGMLLFASKAYGLTKSALQTSVLTTLKSNIKSTGEITDAFGNSFTYGWVVLGLTAAGESKLASLVATKFASLARPDGGFGTDLTGDTMTSAADSTGMALMALAATNKLSSSTASKAIAWLKNAIATDHFEAWGDVDVNGTAYATMGLAAAKQKVTALQTWLASRVSTTGGLTTPWSEGKGDIYATAQGYIALLGTSYLSLIK
jgi:hypothetical protein